MKKTFLRIFIIFSLVLLAGQALSVGFLPAYASEPVKIRSGLDTAADVPGLKPTAGVTDIPSLIGKIVGIALQFVSLLFLIIIVYAGIRWMTASGDTKKVQEARNWMINAAIGLAITLTAYQVVSYVITHITIQQ